MLDEFSECFAKFSEVTAQLVRSHVDHSLNPPSLEGLYKAFVQNVARYKHRGFREEREVRIVAYPLGPKMLEMVKRDHPEETKRNRALKEIKVRDGDVKFVELFGFGRELPISTVIVGPGLNQRERARWVQSLLRKHMKASVRVVCSQTPFIGMRRTGATREACAQASSTHPR